MKNFKIPTFAKKQTAMNLNSNLGISNQAGIDSNAFSLKTATSLTSGNIYDSNNTTCKKMNTIDTPSLLVSGQI